MDWHRRKAAQLLPPATLEALRTIESRVRPDFRRSVLCVVLALTALTIGHGAGGIHASTLRKHLDIGQAHGTLYLHPLSWACGVLVLVFGVLATRSAGSEVARMVGARSSVSAGSTMRLLTLLIGYLLTLLGVLDLVGLPVQLLAGTTVIAVVVGIAAQQVLGNLFAGLVLLFARPYRPGETIRVNSGALGGPHDGVVTEVGLLYTVVHGVDGAIHIPNGAMLAAAVGPVPPDTDDEPASADADVSTRSAATSAK